MLRLPLLRPAPATLTLAVLLAAAPSVGLAQSESAKAPATPAASAAVTATPSAPDNRDAATRGGEPNVQRIVIEDDGARIEELRVRGVTKRITVHSKRGGPDYEVTPADAGRGPPNTVDANGSAGGQRVWSVFSF